jgi:hypothetical protein
MDGGGRGLLAFAWRDAGNPDEIRNLYVQSTSRCYTNLPQVPWVYPLKVSY